DRGIVLMHDSTADIEFAKSVNLTYAMVQILVPALKSQGYQFVPLTAIPDVLTASQRQLALALQASNGKYISPQAGGGGTILVDGPAVGAWETLGIDYVAPGKVAIRAPNGMYLSPQNGGGGDATTDRGGEDVAGGGDRVASRAVHGDPLEPGATNWFSLSVFLSRPVFSHRTGGRRHPVQHASRREVYQALVWDRRLDGPASSPHSVRLSDERGRQRRHHVSVDSSAVLPDAGRRRDDSLVRARPEAAQLQTALCVAALPAALLPGDRNDHLRARQGDSQSDAVAAPVHPAAAGRPAHADALAVDFDGCVPGLPDFHRPGRIAGRHSVAGAADGSPGFADLCRGHDDGLHDEHGLRRAGQDHVVPLPGHGHPPGRTGPAPAGGSVPLQPPGRTCRGTSSLRAPTAGASRTDRPRRLRSLPDRYEHHRGHRSLWGPKSTEAAALRDLVRRRMGR